MPTDTTIDELEKKKPLGLKVKPSLKKALEDKAAEEKRSLANLSETLLEWSFDRMVDAGDSIRLLTSPRVVISPRISQETTEHIYRALAIVLREAPSTQVANVVEYLTRLAGKYSEEE